MLLLLTHGQQVLPLPTTHPPTLLMAQGLPLLVEQVTCFFFKKNLTLHLTDYIRPRWSWGRRPRIPRWLSWRWPSWRLPRLSWRTWLPSIWLSWEWSSSWSTWSWLSWWGTLSTIPRGLPSLWLPPRGTWRLSTLRYFQFIDTSSKILPLRHEQKHYICTEG